MWRCTAAAQGVAVNLLFCWLLLVVLFLLSVSPQLKITTTKKGKSLFLTKQVAFISKYSAIDNV
jgi:hypothetical protein